MKIWFRVNGEPQEIDMEDYRERLKNYNREELEVLYRLQISQNNGFSEASNYLNDLIHGTNWAGDPSDTVDRPAHYTTGKIEVIEYIEDQKLNYNTGNVVKYVSRAGKKDPDKHVEDLQKAAWYLNREINNLKASTK